MSTSIVSVIVNQIQAPTPSTLQKTGAILTQGGTNTAPGTRTLITQPADATSILAAPHAITSITWTANVATLTSTANLPTGYVNGHTFPVEIAGVTPSQYNGTFLATVTGAATFTYPLTSNPGGPATVEGTWVNGNSDELLSAITTFFDQGAAQAVYVLELGAGDVTDGTTDLTTYIQDNPGFFYSYLVPKEWDATGEEGNPFVDFLGGFLTTTSRTYFFVTTTNDTYSQYAGMKCVVAFIEAPDADGFDAAWPFQTTLNYAPSTVQRVPPLAFDFGFNVTPYPTPGNQALFTAWKAAGVNWCDTGAEGGISDDMLKFGTTMDVRPFNYWYAVDWAQINIDLAIANAVINGSNNTINPLYYNQNGIDRLQQVGASVLSSGVTFGLILGSVIQSQDDQAAFLQNLDNGVYAGNADINAIPFVPYSQANPSDYKLGVYNGFSVTMTPLRGFISITFTINVTDFVAAQV